MEFEKLQAILQDSNLKATHQRMVILNELMLSRAHPTADEVHASIKLKNPTISLGTVYRVLEQFVEKGIARKISTSEKSQRYDFKVKPHNHIFVTNTDEIIDYEDDALNELIMEYFKKKNIQNFNIEKVELHLNGEKKDPKKEIKIE